ncbi:MFS transporter [Nocardioides terrisoli]|uniref:MFS transporter n=1 Tax=Nocardioides terrisoli TaxID=3388267 RepID=UPI00287BC750|nr:MFS transporter [Nocardioides marmorisolisilvae]
MRRATASPEADWWPLFAICGGVFMLLLDVTIVNIALKSIQSAFGAPLSGLQWVIDAYALSLAALLLTAGSLADIYGRRRMYVVGMCIFTAGSIFCGLSPNVVTLSIARAVQGIGGAAMFATSLALLSAAYRGRSRGLAFGAFGATTGIAVAVGPVFGGLITTWLSWRWIFWVNVPVGALAIAITLRHVAESRDPSPRRPDWIGFITFGPGLALLIYGLIRSGQVGWTAPSVWLLLGAAALALAGFAVSQAIGSNAMVALGLLKNPTFAGAMLAAAAISASIFSFLAYLVLYLQDVLGYSPAEAGVRVVFESAGSFVSATIAGRLSQRIPPRILIGSGFVLISIGMFLIAQCRPGDDWTQLIPGMSICGLGIGFVTVPLAATAVSVVEPARAAMASGANSTFRQVGLAVGMALLGALFSQRVLAEAQHSASRIPVVSADSLADAVTGGRVDAYLSALDPTTRRAAHTVAVDSFVAAFDHIGYISVAVALVAALGTFALIRSKDLIPGTSEDAVTELAARAVIAE